MRKLLMVVGILLGLTTLFLPGIARADVQDFTIQNFSADYYLSRTAEKASLLEVKESIVAEFPSYDQNRGILRAIPKSYQGHTVSLDIRGVTDQTGQAYPYSTSDQNDNTVLKIGDATKYVHGVMTYNIHYTLRNVINFQEKDEFYWDINGTQWPQAMGVVVGRLHMPLALAEQLTGDQVCYSGAQGSTQQTCTISQSQGSEEMIITTTATDLRGYENATMVVGFKTNTFVQGPEVAQEKRNRIIGIIAMISIMLVLPFITFIVCYRKWWATGRDPAGKGVIIPEYVAPKNLNVLGSSFVLDLKFNPKVISASIIEMATRGHLRISEIEKKKFIGKSTDYELEVIGDTAGLSKEEQLILDALFDGAILAGSRVSISSQKNKLFDTVKKVNDHLSASLTAAGYFTTDPKKARNRFIGGAIAMLVLGTVLFFLLPLGIGLLLSGLIALTFSSLMPARSAQGVQTRDYLLGLKEYIKMAEADRIKYLQSPKGAEKKHIDPNSPKQQVKLFEELLPYAMLFGLEKEWAEQFKDLYNKPPDWYSGNTHSFNTMYLASSLGKFESANSVAFSSPSSSGSSGFGGGSSGGGGGGGGGGGW